MNRLLVLIVLILFSQLPGYSQTEVIDERIYKSIYSFDLKDPLYVVYSIYHGGGNCSRNGFDFKVTVAGTATKADYDYTEYDRGHLAAAQDFAFNCAEEERTFRYYNCVPQTPRLNRGPWKSLENEIREMSKQERITIICGGIYGKKTIGSHVAVPDYCWKIIFHENSRSPICFIFRNDYSGSFETLGYSRLIQILGYSPIRN